MHTSRVTFDIVTIRMACGLVLGGLASPAAAKTIVVNTLDDTADSPFDADGPVVRGRSDLPGTDILGEGGFTGNVLFPVPNAGTENVLEGEIFHNTASTVTVADGTPGNTADVMQFKNVPCP